MDKIKMIMHSTSGCKYCLQAKGLMDHFNIDYTIITEKSPDWPTFPCVYLVNEDGSTRLIGGFTQLSDWAMYELA